MNISFKFLKQNEKIKVSVSMFNTFFNLAGIIQFGVSFY